MSFTLLVFTRMVFPRYLYEIPLRLCDNFFWSTYIYCLLLNYEPCGYALMPNVPSCYIMNQSVLFYCNCLLLDMLVYLHIIFTSSLWRMFAKKLQTSKKLGCCLFYSLLGACFVVPPRASKN